MKKRLEEIERNMKSILEEVNEVFDTEYKNIEISFWPAHPRSFEINFWNGQSHAPLNPTGRYAGISTDLINWIKRRKILFQKFNKVLKEEKE